MTRTALIALGFAAACASKPEPGVLLGGDNGSNGDGGPQIGGKASGTESKTALDDRIKSYSDALRTASLKLTDKLPTLQDVKDLQTSNDPAGDYEKAVDAMFASNEFKARMVSWARDTFRQGGADLDTAPVFLARIVVEGRPLAELFTATSGNCPSYDAKTGNFADGECKNGAPVQAGVLTNPGTMKQFYSSMAFRRVRWVQEMFRCSKFPAEYSDNPVAKGAGQYTSPWDFESIATKPINFQDTSSVVCANCHTSINHLAPLFGNFDKAGMWKSTIQVLTPTAPDPTPTALSHWLKDGETTAWKSGQPVKDLAELGKAMADDAEVKACMVARLWNFTMSKEDIVSDLATVPVKVVKPYIDGIEGGTSMRDTLKAMFKSEDFIRF